MTVSLVRNTAKQDKHDDEPVYYVNDENGSRIGHVNHTLGVWMIWRTDRTDTTLLAADCDLGKLRARLGRLLASGHPGYTPKHGGGALAPLLNQ